MPEARRPEARSAQSMTASGVSAAKSAGSGSGRHGGLSRQPGRFGNAPLPGPAPAACRRLAREQRPELAVGGQRLEALVAQNDVARLVAAQLDGLRAALTASASRRTKA
jgi:hypothetical protein